MASTAKSLALSFSFHHRRICPYGSDSPDFLLTEQSQPLPKWQMFLTLHHFCAPLLNLFYSQSCTGEPSTPGMTSPLLSRGRRRNPSSYMLSVLSQSSPGYLCPSFRQEHFATQFFVQEEHWVLPAELLSSQLPSRVYWCLGLFLTLWRIWDYPLNFMRFPNMQRSLWIVVQPSSTPPGFMSSANFLRVY